MIQFQKSAKGFVPIGIGVLVVVDVLVVVVASPFPHVMQQLFAFILLYNNHEDRKNIRTKIRGTKSTAILISFPNNKQNV
jgi:hypothetical protein